MIAKVCFVLLTSFNTSEKVMISVNDISSAMKYSFSQGNYISVNKESIQVKETVSQVFDILTNKPADKFVCIGGN